MKSLEGAIQHFAEIIIGNDALSPCQPGPTRSFYQYVCHKSCVPPNFSPTRRHASSRPTTPETFQCRRLEACKPNIADAQDTVLLAAIMKNAVIAQRQAYLSGPRAEEPRATASSPLESVLRQVPSLHPLVKSQNVTPDHSQDQNS